LLVKLAISIVLNGPYANLALRFHTLITKEQMLTHCAMRLTPSTPRD